jgi:thymidylate synthase (FAD)
LKIHDDLSRKVYSTLKFYQENKYSWFNDNPQEEDDYYITTNYRVLVENDRLDDLKYLCEPTEYHEKRYCVRFIIDRFTGEEFLRHRVFSFCRESSRYCNYSKEKFGGNITYIIPPWIPSTELAEGENITWWDGDWVGIGKTEGDSPTRVPMRIVKYGGKNPLHNRVDTWLRALIGAEQVYMALTNDWTLFDDIDDEEKKAWQAQQARTILPCAIKSPLAMCGFASDWIHFFHLRSLGTTGAPHPQAKELAEPLMKEFLERGYITEKELYKGVNENGHY